MSKSNAPKRRLCKCTAVLAGVFSVGWLAFPPVVTIKAQNEYHVIVSGRIVCLDNGTPRPLANARVELMDSDNDAGTFGDDLMGVTGTNADGFFSGDGTGGDGGNWSWSKPDVYTRILLDDQWVVPVRMKDELGMTRSWTSPQHDHDNVEGNVDIGGWWWGSQPSAETHNSSAPCVWLDSRDAVLRYANIMGTPPPEGAYEIQYWSGVYSTGTITPFTTLATTYWPRHYSTYKGETSTHEFYHAVRHGYDGDQTHWDWDDTRFLYGRSHNYCDSGHLATHDRATKEGFAFNEGWAEFAGYSHAGWTPSCVGHVGTDMTNEGEVSDRLIELEANVAKALTTLGATESARYRMLAVLRDKPGTIHSYDEYCQAIGKTLPGVCGVAVSPLTISHRQFTPSDLRREVQLNALRSEISAQRERVAQLEVEMRSARQSAADVRPQCSGDDCEVLFKTLIRPFLIERELRVHGLVARHLSSGLDRRASTRAGLRAFELEYTARNNAFLREVAAVGNLALNGALRAARPLAERSKAAAPLIEHLQQKIAARVGRPLPNSDRPDFLTLNDGWGRQIR